MVGCGIDARDMGDFPSPLSQYLSSMGIFIRSNYKSRGYLRKEILHQTLNRIAQRESRAGERFRVTRGYDLQ